MWDCFDFTRSNNIVILNRPAMSLQQRIEEKKRELEALSQIKGLSHTLCYQLEQLETRLDTLADGTEGQCFPSSLIHHVTNKLQRLHW